MALKKVSNYWLLDIQPGGTGCKRYRKRFKTKSQALYWQNQLIAKLVENPDHKEQKKDTRKLSELFKLWYEHHGKTLKAGKDTYNRLCLVAKRLNDPSAFQLTQTLFIDYRTTRLDQNITPNGVNREISYIRAAFNELIRLKLWTQQNPLDGIRQLKIDQHELNYLTTDQIKTLLTVIQSRKSSSLEYVVKICLSTGARWSEAVKLKKEQIANQSITFIKTKSGKSRTVPISEKLYQQLKNLQTINGCIFNDPVKAYRGCLDEAHIKLPRGQSTHVLRHTFASHFIMNGGDILTLQKILGHSSLDMTLRYAHLSPDHLQQAVIYSPMTKLDRD